MVKSNLKSCARCNNLVALRYRIQYQENGAWVLVCPHCWQAVSQDNPHYRYGGTWKAKRK